MIIVMKNATNAQISNVVARIEKVGCRSHISVGAENVVIGVVGDVLLIDREQIERMDGVVETIKISKPYKLASRDFHPHDTVFDVRDVTIGAKQVIIMAGPCAVESKAQMLETAQAVKAAGATMLRGGAYKPRTSPYAFQGMGEEGLELLALAREATGLPVVTEVMDVQAIPLVSTYADVLQVGARNMQNYALLHALGESQRPVLLKRGMMSTIEELLMSAEYILSHGNHQVMLCERVIRTFETYTRNTFDINAIPLLKQLSHLPVIADPSHGTGKWELVEGVSMAAVAAGADGLEIEVHPKPEEALSDGVQSLKPSRFAALMKRLEALAGIMDRSL